MTQTGLYKKITQGFSFNSNKKTNKSSKLPSSNYQKENSPSTTTKANASYQSTSKTTTETSSSTITPSLESYQEVKKCILNRRSIRQFTPHKPPYKMIYDIIDTAYHAPRAGNIVNSHTIVVEDQKVKSTIANLCYQQSWIAQAPYILVITCSQDDTNKLYPDMSQRFATQNTSSYIQNLLLLIHSAGFASCWVESFQEEILKDFLSVPKGDEIHAILPIGFAKENPKVPSSPELMMIMSYDSYGNKSRH